MSDPRKQQGGGEGTRPLTTPAIRDTDIDDACDTLLSKFRPGILLAFVSSIGTRAAVAARSDEAASFASILGHSAGLYRTRQAARRVASHVLPICRVCFRPRLFRPTATENICQI